MFIAFLVIIALIILLIIYVNQPRSERKLRDKFNEFIDSTLRENYCFEKAKEVNLRNPVKLDPKTQLVVFGVTHTFSSWAVFMVTRKNYPTRVHIESDDKFWIQRFTPSYEEGTIKISEPFELQEIVWSSKEIIPARAFIVPYRKSK